MNWQNKEGDIKQILESQEFAFNPHDWEVAEKLLLMRKKRRKKRRLLILLPLPVVLLVALGVYYVGNLGQQNFFTTVSGPSKTTEINNEKTIENNTPGKTGGQAHSQGEPGVSLPSGSGENKIIINNSAEPTNYKTTGKNNSSTNENITGNGDALITVPGKKEEITETNIPATPEEKLNEGGAELPDIAGPIETPPAAPLADTAETPVADAAPEQEEKLAKKEKETEINPPAVRNKIGITAGGNYSRLLSVQRGRFALLPYFAVNYAFVLNSKWQLGAGAAYSVMNGGGLQKQYSVSRHTFGETHTQLTIQTTRLHYLEMPVTARYNFNDKLFFTGGVNAAYLAGIKGNVDESNTGVFAKGPGYSKQASDYRGGLKPWDLQAQLGAEMRYKKQFYLGGLVSGGLLDIGNNGYYNNAAFERNLRLQLYIRYELWNF